VLRRWRRPGPGTSSTSAPPRSGASSRLTWTRRAVRRPPVFRRFRQTATHPVDGSASVDDVCVGDDRGGPCWTGLADEVAGQARCRRGEGRSASPAPPWSRFSPTWRTPRSLRVRMSVTGELGDDDQLDSRGVASRVGAGVRDPGVDAVEAAQDLRRDGRRSRARSRGSSRTTPANRTGRPVAAVRVQVGALTAVHPGTQVTRIPPRPELVDHAGGHVGSPGCRTTTPWRWAGSRRRPWRAYPPAPRSTGRTPTGRRRRASRRGCGPGLDEGVDCAVDDPRDHPGRPRVDGSHDAGDPDRRAGRVRSRRTEQRGRRRPGSSRARRPAAPAPPTAHRPGRHRRCGTGP
jgi:hypothetical protein